MPLIEDSPPHVLERVPDKLEKSQLLRERDRERKRERERERERWVDRVAVMVVVVVVLVVLVVLVVVVVLEEEEEKEVRTWLHRAQRMRRGGSRRSPHTCNGIRA